MYARQFLLFSLWLFSLPVFAIPQIQKWETEQGAPVYFVEAHEIPIVDIQVMFDAGSSRDGSNPGVALMTSILLAEGAAGLDADQLSRNFADIGAKFGAGAGFDQVGISLRSMVEPKVLNAALDNFKKIITQPDFPEKAFEREKNRTLLGIQQKQQSPGDIANDAFFAAIYGDHPYAHPQEGTEKSVTQLNINDVKEFYKKFYTSKNAVIAIVGDLDRDYAEKVANQLMAELPVGEKAAPIPDVKPLEQEKTVKINFPSTQTHVLVGQPGISRDDPDLFPLYVGNNILGGGGMVSRLFEQVREKRGLSYSVYSYFYPLRKPGPFVSGLQTKTDQTDEATNVLIEEIQKFIDNGPTAEELETTKKNLTGNFPLRLDSNADIMKYLAMIAFYGLPLDYLETYNTKIMNVTADQISAAFRRKLVMDKLVKVMVGEFN